MERSSNHRIWTLNLAEEVRRHLSDESSGHDPWHAFRVRQLGAQIAIAIARAFAFGGAHHRPIWNPDPEAVTSGVYGVSSIHHFYEKLLQLHGDMYTAAARQLAVRRVAVMEEFLRTFYAEWDGRDAE